MTRNAPDSGSSVVSFPILVPSPPISIICLTLHGFDIVHDSWALIKSQNGREIRGLNSGIWPLTFEGLISPFPHHKCMLLHHDVPQYRKKSHSQELYPHKTPLHELLQSHALGFLLLQKISSNVNKCLLSLNRISRNHHSFNH